MRAPLVLAVDGGGSKTDLALVRADGEVLSLVRGPRSSPQHLGIEGSLDVLGTVEPAVCRRNRGVSPSSSPRSTGS